MTDPEPRLDLEPLLEHTSYLRRLARSLLKGAGGEDDVVQQAWVAALERPRGTIRSPRAWLAAAVRHLSWRRLRDESRRERREQATPLPDPVEPADAPAARVDALRRLLDAVDGLPDPYRDAVLRRYFDDQTHRQIADARGVPEATARTWVHRGVKLLRARLDPDDDDERRAFVLALAPTAGLTGHAGAATAASTLGMHIGWWMMNGKALFLGAATIALGVSLWTWRTLDDSTSPAGDGPPRGDAAVLGPDRTESEGEVVEPDVAIERASTDVAAPVGGWLVTGRCVTPDGEPVDAVAVRLRRLRGMVGWRNDESSLDVLDQATVASGENGEFAWDLAPVRGPVTIEATATGRHYSTRALKLVLDGARPPELKLTVFPLDGVVAGVVRDRDGQPISGATVIGCDQESISGDDGRYELAVPAGIGLRRVVAYAAGYAAGSVTFDYPQSGARMPVDIELLREVRVTGTVTDDEGAPIAGATVHSSMAPRARVETDRDGRYSLGHLDPSFAFHFVEANKTGYLTESVSVERRGDAATADIVLSRGVPVSGRVTDESGRGLHGARVSFRERDGHDGFEAVTDAAGRFEVLVSSGEHDVTTTHSPLATDRRRVEAGASSPSLEITLLVGRFVGGRVKNDLGAPVAGASVHFEKGMNRRVGEPARTDEHGRFRTGGLVDGPLSVMISAPGHATFMGRIDQLDVEHHEFTIIRAGAIEGRVLDGRTGRPIPSFRVRMLRPTLEDGERGPNALSGVWWQEGYQFHDEEGRFDTREHRIQVGAVCAMEASAPGYAPQKIDRIVATTTPELSAVVFRLLPPVHVTGRVLSARTGAPIADARVQTHEETEYLAVFSAEQGTAVRTDDDGRFELAVSPGAITLRVDTPDGVIHVEESFEMPEHGGLPERTIVVGDFGRIEGRLLDASGNPRVGEKVTLRYFGFGNMDDWSTETDGAGAFAFEDLNQGGHYVSRVVMVDGEEVRGHTRRVYVRHGQTSTVILKPTGTASIAGTVTADVDVPELLRVAAAPKDRPGSRGDGEGLTTRAVFARDGRFHIDGLPAGEWQIEAFFWNDQSLWSGSTSLTLTDGESATVALELLLEQD